jgi:transcriptional regulator with XRE-family HTH domain
MKLSEKIYYCRTKARLSQESLAEKVGVSRQAVSKWENGDAEPEIGKLRLLAEAFGVTADWLLSDAQPEEEAADPAPAESAPHLNWVDSIPGVLGKLLRRYGWLFGVYLAVGGAGFAIIGGLARYISRQMFAGFSGDPFSGMNSTFSGGTVYFDEFGNMINGTTSHFSANNPVAIMGTVILAIGIAVLLAGIILAVVLKKQRRREQ